MKLKGLAHELGLSQTTVSRALNGYPEVNEQTRKRVLEAAKRLGYRPNPSARRLATGRAGAIGAVLPTDRNILVDPHFVEFLAGVGERLSIDEIDIVLSPTRDDEMDSYRRLASGTRVDAVILSSPQVVDQRIDLLAELKLPFILHGRTESSTKHAWLDIDNAGAFHHATSHLLDLGHRRIALINGHQQYTYARHREAGFRRALAERRIDSDERYLGTGSMSDETGFILATRMLALEPRPTALLVTSMMMTLGVLRAVRAAGLELGHDISLIAHDDVLPSLNADRMLPPISTTRSSIRAAGTRVAELVLDMLQGRAPEDISEIWPVELVVRASTGPAPS
ncbi:MAG: substrate-binding domain-containing protein [Alphaproteobacteria bacterium]